jgi:hypothetical protein
VDISSVRYGSEIAAAASAYGLDPGLLAAVAAQETGGPGNNSGRNITGDAGHGHGVFQIDDRSWAFAKTPAAMDPAQNARMAASILSDDLKRNGGDVRAALSAYNTGSPTGVGTQTTWGDGKTLGYADSVLRHYDDLAGRTSTGSAAAASATDLAADQPETSASVGALANYGASLPPLTAAFSPAPAIQTTSAGQQAADAVGAQADKSLANLVGGDDLDDDADGDTN